MREGDEGEIGKEGMDVLVMRAEKMRKMFLEKEEEGGLKRNRGRKRGGEKREGTRRGVQPSRTCPILFHQPSPWKLASSSPSPLFSLSPIFSLLRLERGNQRESGREKEREREEDTVTHTELSEAL